MEKIISNATYDLSTDGDHMSVDEFLSRNVVVRSEDLPMWSLELKLINQ